MPIVSRRRAIADVRWSVIPNVRSTGTGNFDAVDIYMPNNTEMSFDSNIYAKLLGVSEFYRASYITKVRCDNSGVVTTVGQTSVVIENMTNNVAIVPGGTANHYTIKVTSGLVAQTVDWKFTYNYSIKQY